MKPDSTHDTVRQSYTDMLKGAQNKQAAVPRWGVRRAPQWGNTVPQSMRPPAEK